MPLPKEETLSRPVSQWLRSQDMRVYAEVPVHGAGGVDLIGRRTCDDHLIAVELKRSLSPSAVYQARRAQSYVHEAYVAVLVRPTAFANLAIAARVGVGILWWDGKKMHLVLAAGDRFSRMSWFSNYHRSVCDRVSHMRPGGVGGRPCLKGRGPAKDVKKRIQKYMRTHPDVTAHDLFENVHHHYKTAKSLHGVLRRRFGILIPLKRRK